MVSLRNIRLTRWSMSLFVAIIIGVGSFYSLVLGFRDTPLPGHYSGAWTNGKLINDCWPFHIVPVPRAKADALADGLTLFEWWRTEFIARSVAVPVLSLVAFMLTFIAM